MEPLFAALFDLPIFSVRERGGVTRWAHVSECVLDCLRRDDAETRHLVVSTLVDAGVSVAVDIQPHLVLALGAFGKHSPETISPSLVRAHIRHSPAAYERLPRSSKLRLLSFILKDEDFLDLKGICLLPLSDGSFTHFMGRKGSESVFLPTTEFPPQLLPSLKKLLVCTNDVDELLHGKLRKLAESGILNMSLFLKCLI